MELLRIAGQLARCAHGPAWHGPSLREVLDDVSPSDAARHVDSIPHSIAEFVVHIRTWAAVAAKAIDGIPIPEQLADDWTNVTNLSESEWIGIQNQCMETIEGLAGRVKSLSEERLTETVPGRDYDFYLLLHGVVEHTIYHAGQIAMLKRWISGSK